MRLQATFVAAVALCAAAATAPADAEIMYTFTPLDKPGVYSTEPLDINDNGVIVGTYLDETYADQHSAVHGFVYQDNVFGAFDVPNLDHDTTNVEVTGVNDAFAVIGAYQTYAEQTKGFPALTHGFIFDNAFHDLSYPGASAVEPLGINNHGDVVGRVTIDGQIHGFVRDHQTGEISLLDYPGARSTIATGISDDGTVVVVADGTIYSYFDGEFATVPTPSPRLPTDKTRGSGAAINNQGQVAGTIVTTSGEPGKPPATVSTQGFFYNGANSQAFSDGLITEATGINDLGLIVGVSSNGEQDHGFIATPAQVVSLAGGTPEHPTLVVSGLPVARLRGSIGLIFNQVQFYEFGWRGGDFGANALITGADPSAAYTFELLGLDGSVLANTLLDIDHGFAGQIDVASLPAGRYEIGLLTENPGDPDFTITFNTPVNGVAPLPEPSSLALFGVGLAGLPIVRRRINRARG